MQPAFATIGTTATPIFLVDPGTWPVVRARLDPAAIAFAEAVGFEPKPGRHALLPDAKGRLAAVVFGVDPPGRAGRDPFLPGRLPGLLPRGTYRFAEPVEDARLAALAFALGAYRFGRYQPGGDRDVKLVPPDGVGRDLPCVAEAVYLARDLVNTPSNDMGPAELEEVARKLADRHGATLRSIVGDDLLTENFPLVHAVGRASSRAPRLIDLVWGDPAAPKVTLVGKGVCFDTGGLDLKNESSMRLMKKDMGGAATVLALAHMIMGRGLKLRLRVLIPAVENAVSGDAFRPLDVCPSRKGITVEIGNTDAEGRLVLADALALADEEAPELLIDMGTLTGAARVALGPDLPPFYTDDDALADTLAKHGAAEHDPLWRMPLWRPYEQMIESKVAEVNNVGTSGFAGSILCALFLGRFVAAAQSWLHLDIYAWTPSAKPGRPEGGECQAARALYALLCERYG
ncbi:leucyl aminopeptidase family protein [Rhodoplanes roseus]|uniref:Leucyl aminopeptidase n=1 Tax=Rhodoplanes roseus TaxID=29409 RepID=A0A327L041_9BRAD|nr:leucyl aminopeptidase family protein [Rhodoplanes roseus]RAI43233.1 leucyl aminopeptidase [Rhodoplanes roseus]